MNTVYDYFPINIDKLNELSCGNFYDYPKTHETIDEMLQVAFIIGYTRGQNDEHLNYCKMLKDADEELFKKVLKVQLTHSIKERFKEDKE